MHFGTEGRPPLVILHGLLGSSRNWTTAARDLAESFDVYALDLRNHGKSPWAQDCSFAAMADDVRSFLDRHRLERTLLVGHSLGGKVAMRLAADDPQLLDALVVVDIAPRDYAPHFAEEFDAMAALDVTKADRRSEVDAALSGSVPDWAHRQFLLTNLERAGGGGFRWTVNLEALRAALPELARNPLGEGECVQARTLFLSGGKSDFVWPEDEATVGRYFLDYAWQMIPEAGHNVHVEARTEFVAAVRAFTH